MQNLQTNGAKPLALNSTTKIFEDLECLLSTSTRQQLKLLARLYNTNHVCTLFRNKAKQAQQNNR